MNENMFDNRVENMLEGLRVVTPGDAWERFYAYNHEFFSEDLIENAVYNGLSNLHRIIGLTPDWDTFKEKYDSHNIDEFIKENLEDNPTENIPSKWDAFSTMLVNQEAREVDDYVKESLDSMPLQYSDDAWTRFYTFMEDRLRATTYLWISRILEVVVMLLIIWMLFPIFNQYIENQKVVINNNQTLRVRKISPALPANDYLNNSQAIIPGVNSTQEQNSHSFSLSENNNLNDVQASIPSTTPNITSDSPTFKIGNNPISSTTSSLGIVEAQAQGTKSIPQEGNDDLNEGYRKTTDQKTNQQPTHQPKTSSFNKILSKKHNNNISSIADKNNINMPSVNSQKRQVPLKKNVGNVEDIDYVQNKPIFNYNSNRTPYKKLPSIPITDKYIENLASPQVKAPILSHNLSAGSFISIYLKQRLDLIYTPYDIVYDVAGSRAFNSGPGIGVAYHFNVSDKIILGVGLEYNSYNYAAPPIIETYGEISRGIKKVSLKNIHLSEMRLPLEAKFQTFKGERWTLYAIFGLNIHAIMSTRYDVERKSLGAGFLALASPTNAEKVSFQDSELSNKEFQQGILQGGDFPHNFYSSYTLGIGYSYHLTHRSSMFIKGKYNKVMGFDGVGPNNDVLDGINFQIGTRFRL